MLTGMHSRRGRSSPPAGLPAQAPALDDLIEPSRTSRPGLENVVVKPFREDPPRAGSCVATEAASREHENNASPRHRQIRQAARITTMNSRRNRAAPWTRATRARRPDIYDGAFIFIQRAIRRKSRRCQFRGLKYRHGDDSFAKPRQVDASTSSNLSQTRHWTRNSPSGGRYCKRFCIADNRQLPLNRPNPPTRNAPDNLNLRLAITHTTGRMTTRIAFNLAVHPALR